MSADAQSGEDTECPTCGRDDFASERGVKVHHKRSHGESIAEGRTMVELECKRCSEIYEERPHRAERSSYCSFECRKNRERLCCEWCGEDYTVQGARAERSRFCSAECRDAQNGQRVVETRTKQVQLRCCQCGQKYTKPPCEATNSKYCSNNCKYRALSESLSEEGAPKWSPEGKGVTCENCGDKYDVAPSREGETRFCSAECRSEWLWGRERPSLQKEWATIICEGCGDEFSVKPSHKESRRHCSDECRQRRVEAACVQCGETYEVQQSRAGETKFCSTTCKGQWLSENRLGEDHPSWKGGHVRYYGPDWPQQRRKARNRDQHRCQSCGLTEPEHLAEYGCKNPVHHITPIREFRDDGDLDNEAANSLDNLIVLCQPCHGEWEQMAPLRPDTTKHPADD